MNRAEKLSCIIKCVKALLNIRLSLECGAMWTGVGAAECCTHGWMNGSEAIHWRVVCQRDESITGRLLSCDFNADFHISWPLCFKRQFMGLDLTPVLTFLCLTERSGHVWHSYRVCVIIAQHCRLLLEMLIPFGWSISLEEWWPLLFFFFFLRKASPDELNLHRNTAFNLSLWL